VPFDAPDAREKTSKVFKTSEVEMNRYVNNENLCGFNPYASDTLVEPVKAALQQHPSAHLRQAQRAAKRLLKVNRDGHPPAEG
jgi:hypothetical protein